MGRKKKIRHVVVGFDGDPCRRCGEPTEIREHPEITAKELRKGYYYSRWFYCKNPQCQSKQIMPERFIVWNNDEAKEAAAARREARGQMTPPPGWL